MSDSISTQLGAYAGYISLGLAIETAEKTLKRVASMRFFSAGGHKIDGARWRWL